jgi:hypothetical protein
MGEDSQAGRFFKCARGDTDAFRLCRLPEETRAARAAEAATSAGVTVGTPDPRESLALHDEILAKGRSGGEGMAAPSSALAAVTDEYAAQRPVNLEANSSAEAASRCARGDHVDPDDSRVRASAPTLEPRPTGANGIAHFRHPLGSRSSGELWNRVATHSCGQGVAEVGAERAALEPAGRVDGEQPFDHACGAKTRFAPQEIGDLQVRMPVFAPSGARCTGGARCTAPRFPAAPVCSLLLDLG